MTISIGSDPGHTHTSTHSLTHSQTRSIFLAQLPPVNMNSSGEWKFQILLNQKHKSQARHKQTKEGVRRHKGLKSQYSQVNFIWLSHSPRRLTSLFFSGPQPRSMHFHWCLSSNSASRSATRYLYSLTFDRRWVWPAHQLLGPITSSKFNRFLAVVPSTCYWAPQTAPVILPASFPVI